MLVGGEGGKVHLYNVNTKQLVYEFDTKTNRSVNLSHAHFRIPMERCAAGQLYITLMFPCVVTFVDLLLFSSSSEIPGVSWIKLVIKVV